MSTEPTFEHEVHRLIAQYEVPPLQAQLQQVLNVGAGLEAQAFWLRESEDLVNIVALGTRFIWDVSWQPKFNMCQAVILRLSHVVSVETRDSQDAALSLGLSVSGNLAVVVHVMSDRGGVVWAAHNDDSASSLRRFTEQVLRILAS